MAAKSATFTPLKRGGGIYTWTNVTETDTFAAVEVPDAADMSLQLGGTFGGATVTFQGSNDGTTYAGLADAGGTAISKTAAALVGVRERCRYVKPVAASGSAQSLSAWLFVRRNV